MSALKIAPDLLEQYIKLFKLRFKGFFRKNKNIAASSELVDLFETKIKPQLQPIETIRLQKLAIFKERQRKVMRKAMPIAALISVPIAILAEEGGWLWFIAFAFFIGTAWSYSPALDYIRLYKEKVMPLLVPLYGDFKYQLKANYDEHTLKQYSICPYYTTIYTEDYVTGKLENIDFEFCEIALINKNKSHIEKIFEGCVITLTMPFEFGSHTQVYNVEKSILTKRLTTPKNKVTLENPLFENEFETFSDDQIMARYILTPVMMEQILALTKLFNESLKHCTLNCEFLGNKAVFMISYHGNLIEPAWLSTSAYEFDTLPLIEQELKLLTSIAQQLNLDQMAQRRSATQKLKAG